jgi:tetratricopeptide (TPR) repeat protein
VSGIRAWLAGLPAAIRWTLLAVGGLFLLTLVAGGVWSWRGHQEEAARRALGPVLATAERAVGSGQPTELEAAAAALRQFLASHPSARASHQAWYFLGQVEFRRSQWDPAIAAFAEASRRDRGSIGALSRLGQGYAFEAKGDAARALEVYQQALSGGVGPKDFLYGDFLLAKARAQELIKDSTGAIATYRQYLKDLPSADRVQDVRIRLALLGSAG